MVLKKATPALTPVEQARQDVQGAVQAFLDAQVALSNASGVLLAEVQSNEALIRSLQEENAALTAEADRATSVASKIGAILE